jgi:CPA2 family monovalent cation:H+ antiporter-2
VPTTVGLLVTGMVAGPHGLKLVHVVHEVETLSEIGVILLLFVIGIEFPLSTLSKMKKSVLLGGSLQVALTTLAVVALLGPFLDHWGEAVFMGFLVALSSTAIVLRVMQKRGVLDSPQGNTSLAILIFQDVIVVPMMLLTPILAGESSNIASGLGMLIVKGAGMILLVLTGAKYLVPRLLFQVARTRIRELFLASILVICLGVVWLTSIMGLSVALGAFLAGLIISESEYSHQALGNVIPFRDVFASFFFVSIGMLLDLHFFVQKSVLILIISFGVLTLKSLVACGVTMIVGFPLRTAILTGLSLNQLGEFSFILAKNGIEHGLLAGDAYQVFLAVAILTMALTPFSIDLAPRIADFMIKLPMPDKLKTKCETCSAESRFKSEEDHLVIIGFGLTGKNLASAAKLTDIPYVIVEMNADTVREEHARGEPIFYGDATHESVLLHANIKNARTVVIAINDPTATRRITELARRLNPGALIIVRTRYVIEIEPLHRLGANEVIPEEYETSVEIFTRVLDKYQIPKEKLDSFISEIRAAGYRMFRGSS